MIIADVVLTHILKLVGGKWMTPVTVGMVTAMC